jgi:putative PIG3 family NAD(P)H quinone oxidoreductase
MRAVVYQGPVITVADLPEPVPGDRDLLVRVAASGLNRADVLQRHGEYPVPAGQSTVPGIEVAGEVVACGRSVRGYRPGDRVFGVVEGGGFAEYCLLDEGMAMPVPDGWGLRDAAAAAEAFLTADQSMYHLGGLTAGRHVLIHAAASGIGTMMVRMAKDTGAIVYATVGSEAKRAAVRALGADVVLDRHVADLAAAVRAEAPPEGVDLVMDVVGGSRFTANLAVLRDGGCLVVLGLLDGFDAKLDLLELVDRRLQIKGTALRVRPIAEKRRVTARFRQRWGDSVASLRPVVHAEYPLADLAAAQEEMESGRNIGKIVMRVAA